MPKTYLLGFVFLVQHSIHFGKADASMMRTGPVKQTIARRLHAVVGSKRSGSWREGNNDTHVNIRGRPTKYIRLYGLR